MGSEASQPPAPGDAAEPSMPSLGRLLQRAARSHAGRAAITCGGRQLRFAEVFDRATRLSNALASLGGRPARRVGVLLPNCVEMMEIEFGCALAGAARASLNYRLAPAELLRSLEALDVDVLIFTGRHAAVAEEAAGRWPGITLVGLRPHGEDPPLPAGLDYADWLAAASPRLGGIPSGNGMLYTLFSTSGTTGNSKGVMLTHRAQLAVATSLLLEYGPVRPGDGILLPQPLSHGGGFFMLPYFLSGGHCVAMESFDPAGAFELAERYRIETLKLVPAMIMDMLRAGVGPSGTYRPGQIIYGASPIPRERLEDALTTFGPVFSQLYGQAEAPMCITVLPKEDHVADAGSRLLNSAGRPFRGVEVRVVSEDGRDVEPGEPGEVIVRGPHVMSGYWRDPEGTRAVLRGGYVHTRDLATVDDQGYVFLLGRMDDMINSGGFNIPPLLVEQVLHGHPAVHEAAVIGTPDERWGEVVTAYVVLRGGRAATADEIMEYCREPLGMQRPRIVNIVPGLPKNAYGKIMKSALRTLPETP